MRNLLCLVLAFGALHAHAQRAFSQPELDAMLAPVALYPDPLLTHVLTAAIFPQDVAAAANWSRANAHLTADDALRVVEPHLWHPSVKALVAYPDVLARMAESPQWVADLGEAYSGFYPAVSATIQQLRARAEATGHLRSDEQQNVYRQNDAIYVQPVYPNIVYAPYYNPYVVYGTWWWPAFRPVYWRPWHARPVIVTHHHHFAHRHHSHHQHSHHQSHREHRGNRDVVHMAPAAPTHVVRQPVGLVRPMTAMPAPRAVESRPHRPVPESRRAPIVQSAPAVRSAPVQQVREHHGRFLGNAMQHDRGNGNGRGNGHRGGGRHGS